jgi:hypothetical protein
VLDGQIQVEHLGEGPPQWGRVVGARRLPRRRDQCAPVRAEAPPPCRTTAVWILPSESAIADLPRSGRRAGTVRRDARSHPRGHGASSRRRHRIATSASSRGRARPTVGLHPRAAALTAGAARVGGWRRHRPCGRPRRRTHVATPARPAPVSSGRGWTCLLPSTAGPDAADPGVGQVPIRPLHDVLHALTTPGATTTTSCADHAAPSPTSMARSARCAA